MGWLRWRHDSTHRQQRLYDLVVYLGPGKLRQLRFVESTPQASNQHASWVAEERVTQRDTWEPMVLEQISGSFSNR